MINVTYRIMKRGMGRFVVEALRDDHGTWRHIDEFPTLKEASARMAMSSHHSLPVPARGICPGFLTEIIPPIPAINGPYSKVRRQVLQECRTR